MNTAHRAFVLPCPAFGIKHARPTAQYRAHRCVVRAQNSNLVGKEGDTPRMSAAADPVHHAQQAGSNSLASIVTTSWLVRDWLQHMMQSWEMAARCSVLAARRKPRSMLTGQHRAGLCHRLSSLLRRRQPAALKPRPRHPAL